jgi:beta-glucanase (GH16 family)
MEALLNQGEVADTSAAQRARVVSPLGAVPQPTPRNDEMDLPLTRLSVLRPVLPAIVAAALLSASPETAPSVQSSWPPAGYRLVWSDEFDGRTLDLGKWDYRGLGPRRDGVNVKECVSLDGDGHLVLETRRVGGQYHTGMIGTQGRFEPRYGYFECRVRMQSQVGHWSAFWLQSPTYGQRVGSLEESGAEIDVFEFLVDRRDRLQHTVHWDGYGTDHQTAERLADAPGIGRGWHTVGLLWTPEEYVFSIDGRETWRTGQGVSKHSQYLILSLEVGPWAGEIAKAQLPDRLSVDFVRVYSASGQEAQVARYWKQAR